MRDRRLHGEYGFAGAVLVPTGAIIGSLWWLVLVRVVFEHAGTRAVVRGVSR